MGKDRKKQGAATGARATCRLEPVSYRISLVYLGGDRVQRRRGEYQCRFHLEADGSLKYALAPFVIPNIAEGLDADRDASRDLRLAATPNADGGDNRNPESDQVHRILIHDRHGQISNSDRRAEYAEHDWNLDVEPAVAFRVVVRKFVGDKQVDVDDADGLSVDVELKDPPEELEQYDGRRREFLGEIFSYEDGVDPARAGNDNGPMELGGMRDGENDQRLPMRNADGQAGLEAARLLRAAPPAPLPEIDEQLPPIPNTGLNPAEYKKAWAERQVPFSGLTAAAPAGAPNVGRFKTRAAVEKVPRRIPTPAKRTVGLADFVLRPGPIGGDNYRFLITLRMGGQDVRETIANGRPVALQDYRGRQIPLPFGYLTGRFVMWRQLSVRLVVLANGIGLDDIDWDAARSNLGHAFVDLPPIAPGHATHVHALTRSEWIAALRREFMPASDDADWSNHEHFSSDAYEKGFFPSFLIGDEVTDANHNELDSIAERLLREISTRNGYDPSFDPHQFRSDGGHMLLIGRIQHPCNTIGFHIGNRMLWLDAADERPKVANTLLHELGHSLYLEHAESGYGTDSRYVTQSAADPVPTLLYDPTPERGDELANHDPVSWLECTMSYKYTPTHRYCGKCALSLRHYDMSALRRANAAQGMAPLNPVAIVDARVAVIGDPSDFMTYLKLSEPALLPSPPRAGESIKLIALSGPVTPPPDSKHVRRINLTKGEGAGSPPQWSVSPPSAATVSPKPLVGPSLSVDTVELTFHPDARGKDVEVTFSLGGARATAVFSVAGEEPDA